MKRRKLKRRKKLSRKGKHRLIIRRKDGVKQRYWIDSKKKVFRRDKTEEELIKETARIFVKHAPVVRPIKDKLEMGQDIGQVMRNLGELKNRRKIIKKNG